MSTYNKTLLLIIAFLLFAFLPVYINADTTDDEEYAASFEDAFPAEVDIQIQDDESMEEYAMRIAILYQDLYTKLRNYHLLNHSMNNAKFTLVLDENESLRHDALIDTIMKPIIGIAGLGLGGLLVYLGSK